LDHGAHQDTSAARNATQHYNPDPFKDFSSSLQDMLKEREHRTKHQDDIEESQLACENSIF